VITLTKSRPFVRCRQGIRRGREREPEQQAQHQTALQLELHERSKDDSDQYQQYNCSVSQAVGRLPSEEEIAPEQADYGPRKQAQNEQSLLPWMLG